MTVDLLAALDELAAEARHALNRLADGEAVSGACALKRIQDKAADTARWAREDEERARV